MKTTRTIVTTTKTELRITASEIRRAFNLPEGARLILEVPRYTCDGDLIELDDKDQAITSTTETTDEKVETE